MEATAKKMEMKTTTEELITGDIVTQRIKSGLKKFKLKKIKGESEIPYPMSLKYGQKDWNIVSSLREFISNALDTKNEYNIIYDNGFAVISDSGTGLPQSAFIFGESERDESQIGQFGEGLKMACLTLLRYNRAVWIETVGFTVLVEKISSSDVISQIVNKKESKSVNLMKFRFIPNEKMIGTDIFVECNEEELIESKNLFLDLNNLEKVDNNVFLPSGDIFILGLKTTKLPNTLFSYNIDDKRLTNRDRNIVETSKLQENIVDILKGAKNQKFIKEYLSSFSNNPNAYEYQLSFLPDSKRKDAWVKVLNRVYSKAVLSTDVQSDHYATAMGYKVLRNIPSNVLNVIKYLGLKESNEVAKNYKGEGLIKNNKMIFPISEDYIGSWKREDGIREFIANSLDAGDKIRITHNGVDARISDNGIGILKKHFILGISQKDKTAIGQFGEGLKMACLVLARTGSPVKIETIGTTYEATIEYSEEFGAKLLVVYFNKNSRTKGTSIVFKCTESELEKSKSMFAQFSGSKRKSISMDEMDISFDNPGVIYSNGLETTRLNAIFSYNIKDKGIVSSRDRNAVDTYKLNTYIGKFLGTTINEEAIMMYLTNWMTNTNNIEYNANFFPSDTSNTWRKVIKKAFPKACFEYEYERYSKEDFIAKQAGYQILSNVPYNIQRILKTIGKIESSSKVALKYRNKGILLENKLIYPVTSDFACNWSISNAIQELIANAIDTGTKTNISAKDGLVTISDKGDGLSKRNLLFDGSGKSKEQIGQFGEGLKMASLVLARNNRDFKVVTKGFEYTAKIERDKEFNADVLVIYLNKNKKKIGTDITFKGTEIEIENVKKNFLMFNKKFKELDENIYSEGGYLFVNGVFIQRIDSIFSYNIKDIKDIVTRDRRNVDIEKVKPIISNLLSNAKNKKLIESFIINKQYEKLEHQLTINPSSLVKNVWKQVVEKVYNKCCFATGSDYDGVARDKGFTLLFNLSNALMNLLTSFGIQYSDRIVTLKGDEKDIKKKFDPKNLSPMGKKRWEQALNLFADLYGVRLSKKIELVETFKDGVETDSTWGLYNSLTDTIYILAELFEDVKHTEEEITGVLIHEQIHRKSRAYDRTREFEFALSMELGRIAQMYIKLANKK